MKSILFLVAFALQAGATPATIHAPNSAMDGLQLDGVDSDAALKTAGWTRRHWLEMYPVQAREYWAAWDCEGRSCDSKWNANIRAKAVLIVRTAKDPKRSLSADPLSQ